MFDELRCRIVDIGYELIPIDRPVVSDYFSTGGCSRCYGLVASPCRYDDEDYAQQILSGPSSPLIWGVDTLVQTEQAFRSVRWDGTV